MNRRLFLRSRRPAWLRFEELLRLPRSSWETADVTEFVRLLRELSGDLATIRSRDWGQSLVAYLNTLMAQGHNHLYAAPPTPWSAVGLFLSTDFPRLFRKRAPYFFTACLLFFVPLGVAWTIVAYHPEAALYVVSPAELAQYDQMYASEPATESATGNTAGNPAEAGMSGTDDTDGEQDEQDELEELQSELQESFGDQRAAMAGFYIQHNVGIALQCFARGLLLGVGTAYTLLFNGISIGTVAGYVISQGHSERFLSFVVSHGSFELTAIAIAGGAGLMLGDALIHPGARSRAEALRHMALEAVQIAGGAAVMLVIAALIEGFWSPAPLPATLKYSVGLSLWVLVVLYLTLAGRRQ